MRSLLSPVLVGVLLAFGLGTLVFFISIAGRKGMSRNETYELHMSFNDASGLANRSRVVIAGIDIGRIESIGLEGRRARVTIRVAHRYTLYEDASVMKRAESLLGDALLDIDPGTEGKRPLKDGDEIVNVVEASGMDQLLDSFQGIADDAKVVSGKLAGDEGQEAIANILQSVNESSLLLAQTLAESSAQLTRILGHVESLTRDVSRLSAGQEAQIAAILANLKEVSEDARRSVASVRSLVDNHDEDLDEAVNTVKRSLERFDNTLASMESVAASIEAGEGSLGKLLKDEELADAISHTTKGATSLVDQLTGLRLELGLRSEGHLQPQSGASPDFSFKHTVGAKIHQTNSSRYFGIDAVTEPRGHLSRSVQREVIDGNASSLLNESWSEKLRVNAYVAQRFGPATFRVGVLESTGGVGADLDLIPGSLSLQADAFDFSPATGGAPRLRTMLRYSFLKHFDLYLGSDDLLNNTGPPLLSDPEGLFAAPGRTFFLGGGLRFSNKDIKSAADKGGDPASAP